MVGAYAGNRLGAVRDAKGKAVAAVFAELGNEQKAEVWIKLVSDQSSPPLPATYVSLLTRFLQIIKALVMKLFGPSGII